MFRRVNNNKFGVIEYAIDDEEDLDKLPKGDTNNTVYAILRKDGKNLIYLYSKEVEDYVLINGDLEEINTELESINEQLETKANEVDLKVERARIDSFIRLPEGSTTGDAELIDTRIDSYGLTYNTAGEAIRTQISEVNENIIQVATSILNGSDITLGKKTFFNMTSGTVHVNKDINNPTPSTTGCYHKGYINGGTTIYFDDTKYQLLAIYYNENKVGLEYKPWALTSPITLDEKYPYHVIQMKRKDSGTIDILDVGNTTYKVNEKSTIKNNLNKNYIFYVSPEGDDNNNGLDKTTPLKTFQRAIDLGGTIIYGKRGIYPYQTIKADNKPELKIMPYDYEEYSTSQHERKKISFIGGTELSSLVNEDGILKTTFAPAVRFHSVFVTKSLPPTFDQGISDKLLSNNAGLWQIHNDSSLDKMLTPVLSKGELVEGSFYCDGTYIFIKPYNTEYTKFISCNGTDDPIVKITNCGEVVLEDIEVLYSYYESFMIRNCMNTTIRNCKAGYNVLSSAINLDYTNANLYNCYATHCRKDGYGIGQYGVSNFYDCDAFYCMDDGMSHHFGCVASVYGGRYVGNGKGGNAPTYGAKVTIHNCFFKDNKFGIYAVSATDKVQGVEIPVYNCVFENNTRDILSDKTKVLLINCVKKGSTEQDSGQIVIY